MAKLELFTTKPAHALRFLNDIRKLGFHPFVRRETSDAIGEYDQFCVSAEHDDDAADYYAAIPNSPVGYINQKLIDYAEKRGYFWDWENPGCIFLCD